jgi:protein phosphatase
MQQVQTAFDVGAATHVGKVRGHNEDNYLVEPSKGIWAVADGMGGHAAGEVASATIVEELNAIPPPTSAEDLLANCEAQVFRANERLLDISAERGTIVGSTAAILLIYGRTYTCVWSGDSRIYCIRDGEIRQLTRDHTEAEDLIAEGKLTREEARTWSRRNVITRAIGVNEDPELEEAQGVLGPNDTFIICSDGLSSHVEDHEILDLTDGVSSQQACDALIELTLERGASDNVTVVVVRNLPQAARSTPARAVQDNIWE